MAIDILNLHVGQDELFGNDVLERILIFALVTRIILMAGMLKHNFLLGKQ